MKKSTFFYVIFAVFVGLPSSLKASAERHLRMGDVMAAQKLGQIEADKAKAGDHPFFHGESQGAGLNPDVAKMLQAPGKKFAIDPITDPLVRSADPIRDTSLKVIGGEGTHSVVMQDAGRDEIATCEEPGDDSIHSCKSRIHVEIREELGPETQGVWEVSGPAGHGTIGHLLTWQKAKHKRRVAYLTAGSEALRHFIASTCAIPLERVTSAAGANIGNWTKIRHKTRVYAAYRITYTYRPLIKVAYSSWVNTCDGLETQSDEGMGHYVSKECTQGPETRVFDGVEVFHPCWEHTFTYACSAPCADNCGPLRARGCVQTHSSCKQHIGPFCVVYQQTYQCKGETKTQTRIRGGDTPFCLDGACRDQTYDNNNEMMSSISQLALLKEFQGVFDFTVFKGAAYKCSKNILNFKDCCGSGKGWGVSLGLGGCGAGEKALQLKRQKKFCHFVGTYCAEKVLGKCIKKKSSYCCFGSKLLKAFQVQGRSQIGKSWGSGKNPDCGGFTIDEIQRIDFSKIDLREAFEDLMQNFSPARVQDVNQQIQERLEIMKESIRHQDRGAQGQSPQQRESS